MCDKDIPLVSGLILMQTQKFCITVRFFLNTRKKTTHKKISQRIDVVTSFRLTLVMIIDDVTSRWTGVDIKCDTSVVIRGFHDFSRRARDYIIVLYIIYSLLSTVENKEVIKETIELNSSSETYVSRQDRCAFLSNTIRTHLLSSCFVEYCETQFEDV